MAEEVVTRQREDFDYEMYLALAKEIGRRKGTCIRRNVGSILVADGRMREAGWNGMERLPDQLTCVQGACPRGQLSYAEQPAGRDYSNCIYRHSEMIVMERFRHSVGARNVEGWAEPFAVTVYSSSVPCEDCSKYAAEAGINFMWGSDEHSLGTV